MSMVITVKAIKPKELNVKAFERAVEKGLDKSAKIIEKSFEETMRTFRKKFPVLIKDDKFSRLIWVDGETYSYLNFGTSIRWALMTGNWKSKTKPGRIGSGPGRGRVIVAGRRAMTRRGIRPRPGIKARHFDKQIVKRDGPKVQKPIDSEIDKAAKNAF